MYTCTTSTFWWFTVAQSYVIVKRVPVKNKGSITITI